MPEEIKKEDEPQPIELTATFYPDGRLHIVCPLMADPFRMLGFLEFIKDGAKKIMEGKGEEQRPKIHKPGFLDGLRRPK